MIGEATVLRHLFYREATGYRQVFRALPGYATWVDTGPRARTSLYLKGLPPVKGVEGRDGAKTRQERAFLGRTVAERRRLSQQQGGRVARGAIRGGLGTRAAANVLRRAGMPGNAGCRRN